MLTLEIIDSYDEFKGCRDKWEKLLSESRVSNVFLTYDWIDSYIKHFCKSDRLLILNVFEGGRLAAIAPLVIRKGRYFGMPVRAVRFIGTAISDRIDFIICGNKEGILGAILDYLMAIKGEWDFVDLQEIAEYTGTMAAMEICLDKKGFVNILGPARKSFFIELNGKRGAVLNRFHRKFNAKLRKLRNKQPGIEIDVERPAADADALSVIADIERHSWKRGRCGALFSEKNYMNFHKEIFEKFSKSNQLGISILNLNKTPAAYVYNYLYEGRSYNYSIAYDEAYSDVSPGTILMFCAIRDSASSDAVEFDFARGEGSWKIRLTDSFRTHNRVRIFKTGAYSRFLYILQSKIIPCMKAHAWIYRIWMKIKGALRWN